MRRSWGDLKTNDTSLIFKITDFYFATNNRSKWDNFRLIDRQFPVDSYARITFSMWTNSNRNTHSKQSFSTRRLLEIVFFSHLSRIIRKDERCSNDSLHTRSTIRRVAYSINSTLLNYKPKWNLIIFFFIWCTGCTKYYLCTIRISSIGFQKIFWKHEELIDKKQQKFFWKYWKNCT